jgi:photosystem II stability/assembly factor-like uncharacterized protein
MSAKKYLILLLAGILSLEAGQAQWNIEKCPTKNNLNAISFIENNSGWIVGDRGTILYLNGGEWKESQKLTTEDLNSIFMINKNNGWAVGSNGTIVKFNGNNWELYGSPTRNNLLSVSFKDSENGIAVGDFGTILIFKNGCWNLLESEVRGSLFSVFYKKDETWIGGGLECVNVPIFKMEINNSKKIIINPYDPYASIKSIMFLNPDNGWAVGSPSTILHFNGQQWGKDNATDDYSSLNSVFFSDENNGISVGYGGTVLIYSDNFWIKEKHTTTQNLNGATIINNKYFAVGDSGTIIQRNLTSNNILTDIHYNNPVEIQVFPNPCDEYLNVVIPYENDDMTVVISVSNISGEIIMQKELKLGKRNLNYPVFTGDLKNGLYIIKANIKNKITSNKFIIRH